MGRRRQRACVLAALCCAISAMAIFFAFFVWPAHTLSPMVQATPQPQQREEPWLDISGVDASQFPLVRARLLTADAESAPVADLSAVIVRENGVPIPEYTAGSTPVGVDVVFVIDANDTVLQVDDKSGRTRLAKIAESIGRFADHFMNPAGLDRVSIVAPGADGQSVQWIVRDADEPVTVAAAVDVYAESLLAENLLRDTPLHEMLVDALDHLAGNEAGRFRAILLLTDGARLDQQLDFPALVEQALTEQVPIFAAILGARADDHEVANVARLYEPTRGRTLHMPQPEVADPFYQLWQQQGRQAQLEYASLRRESGMVELSVQLGNVRDSTTFEVTLAAPEVAIEGLGENNIIRRAGSSPDTLLPLLQPASQPLTATVAWPDGRPRRLTRLNFLVNGQMQPVTLETGAAVGEVGEVSETITHYPLIWDISDLDAGVYRLQVQIEDELGYQAVTPVTEVEIMVIRPGLPTPTAAPTSTPLLPEITIPARVPWLWVLPIAGVGATLLLLLGLRARRSALPGEAAEQTAAGLPPPPVTPPEAQVALIERLDSGGVPTGEQFLIKSSTLPGSATTFHNMTIGRDPEAVDFVLEDAGVSRLHARIHGDAKEGYWLHDEGSAGGTYLNFERLGLAPRQLEHGDVIQFGRVMFRFILAS